jgi:SAM-dependent methyltransferase
MIQPVCPDEFGELVPAGNGYCCHNCGRLFPLVGGILELLPLQSFQESSKEHTQLQHYASSLSQRPERAWHQPLRFLLAQFGNGYLYMWAANCVEASAEGRSLSILDAGCGDGILHYSLSQRHFYTGVDFSTRLLVRALRHYPATYYRSDLNHLPFLPDCFDVVVSLQALQYVAQPEQALREMSRVLRPNGKLVLTVPNAESFKYRFQGIPEIQLQEFDRQTIISLVSRSFHIQHLEARGLWLPLPKVSLHAPGVYSSRWALSWTILATPRK